MLIDEPWFVWLIIGVVTCALEDGKDDGNLGDIENWWDEEVEQNSDGDNGSTISIKSSKSLQCDESQREGWLTFDEDVAAMLDVASDVKGEGDTRGWVDSKVKYLSLEEDAGNTMDGVVVSWLVDVKW